MTEPTAGRHALPADALRALVLGLMGALATACDSPARTSSDTATTRSATPAGEHALASFPADSAGRRRLTLSIAPCGATACPVLVRLVDGAKTLDSTRLDWAGVVAAPVVDSANAGMGIGDPATPETLVTWTTGEEEGAVSTTARTVALTASRPALLVAQAAGFEHVKHRHYLLAADSAHIVRVWSAEETARPGWSIADPGSVEGGQGLRLLRWRFVTGDNVSEIADWTVEQFSWNPDTRTLDATHGAVPVFAVVLPGGNTAAAQKLLRSGDKCVDGFALMRPAGAASGARAVAALLTSRKSVADSVAAAVARCPSHLAARVEAWAVSDTR